MTLSGVNGFVAHGHLGRFASKGAHQGYSCSTPLAAAQPVKEV
jgi:hypothetical protein